MIVHAPQTYAEWRHCITTICAIPLTQSFIEERLKSLHNVNDHMTTGFIHLYGETQWRNTVQWLKQAKIDLDQNPV